MTHPTLSPEAKDLPHADEVGIEELLRTVGVRDEPSPEVAEEVMRAVRAEWRDVVEVRTRRRRVVGYGVAAGIATAVLAVATLLRTTPSVPPVEVATIARVEGRVHVGSSGAVTEAKSGDRVPSGTVMTTDGQSRVALEFADGLSVRVDAGSTLLMTAADRIVLRAGAVYVDARPGMSGAHPLTIDTPAGSVRHVGTQYLVRAIDGGVEIGVREGRVELSNERGASRGEAGELLRVGRDGQIARERIDSQDAAWAWATRVAPPFDIADSTVAQFLVWVARETGKRLQYANADAERSADSVKLHGSISKLDPETALSAVLSTTGLRRVAAEDDLLIIDAIRD